MDDYRRGGHTKYSMKVHLIFVSKYRKMIFKNQRRAEDVKQFLYEAAAKKRWNILETETDKDHVHMLLEYSPKESAANIVSRLKEYSTYQMWRCHEEYLSKAYWKHKQLWSDGYFACTIGQASQKTIEHYIQSQG